MDGNHINIFEELDNKYTKTITTKNNYDMMYVWKYETLILH